MDPNPFAANSIVWPMTALLGLLFVLKKIEQDVRPIFVSVSQGLAQEARGNAAAYAMAIGFGLSGSLIVLSDESAKLGWPYVAAIAKVLNPFVSGCVAYATQNKFKGGDNPPVVKTIP